MSWKSVGTQNKKRMISEFIPYLYSCPTHLFGLLAPKKMIEKDKSKKKIPSYIHDDFHVHSVGTNSKTQQSNMHQKLKGLYPYIYTEKTYWISKSSDMITLRSEKRHGFL